MHPLSLRVGQCDARNAGDVWAPFTGRGSGHHCARARARRAAERRPSRGARQLARARRSEVARVRSLVGPLRRANRQHVARQQRGAAHPELTRSGTEAAAQSRAAVLVLRGRPPWRAARKLRARGRGTWSAWQVQRLARSRVERARGRPAAHVGAAAPRARCARRYLYGSGQPSHRTLTLTLTLTG